MSENRNSFNDTHPELRQGEMFLSNFHTDPRLNALPLWELQQSPPFPSRQKTRFETCDYETKRMGEAAYDVDGNPIEGSRPIFVQREEYERNKARHAG